jgi:hypothetical protein
VRIAALARRVWAAPCSAVGLSCGAALLLLGGSARCRAGVLEFAGPPSGAWRDRLERRLPFRAITLGHVIIGISHAELAVVRAHEQVHVAQYERWGAGFFVAYLASSAWQWLRGRRAYWDNRFEVEARRLAATGSGHEDRA